MRQPKLALGLSLLACLVTAPAVHAQSIRFDLVGGSIPGQVDLSLSNGPFGLSAVIILSVSSGPTPLALVDPADPRVLDVGIESLGASMVGLFLASGTFTPPPIPVPNAPWLVDAALFCQGISLPGTQYVVGPISNPRAVRFAMAGTFRNRATQFVTPRAFFPVLPTGDDKWMIAGGGSGGLLSQVAQKTTEVYDPIADTFAAGPVMNFEHALHTATLLNDGRWLLVCGVDRLNDPKVDCETYKPSTNTFTTVAATNDKRMGHTATLLGNGKVLVTGGMSDLNTTSSQLDPIYSTLKTTEIYDPVANTWTRGPNLSIPRAGHGALLLPDGRVLLCGGISFVDLIIFKVPSVSKTCDIYDPTTNTISAGPSMASEHAVFASIATAPGKFLITGGVGALSLTNLGTPTNVAELYTASTGAPGAWSSAGTMSKARGLHTAFALGGGRFLHVGGADGQIFSPNALDSTEIWDATAGWSAGPKLAMSRSGYGSFLAPTGQIHILGGGSGLGAGTVNFTEWYYR